MPDLSHIAEPLRPLAVDIETLTLDPANARQHPERNMQAIANSLRRFGQRLPIVVQKQGMVVRAGNGRVEAAKGLGWTHIAAVVVDESEVEATAFAIADNRSSDLAEWDNEALADLLQSLPADVQIDIGFDQSDLDALLAELSAANPVEVVEDEVPEPPVDPVTKPGDLILLGEHRLLCGDSTNAEDVAMLLSGRTPFIMVTDPPYGVDYDADWRDEFNTWGKAATTSNVTNDTQIDWTASYKLFPGHVAYVWHAGRHAAELVLNLHHAEFGIRTQIIWRKPTLIMGRGHYHWQHEPCWYAVRKGGSAKWCGDRTQSTIWEIQGMHAIGRKEERVAHPTQKPVECMARPIRNHGGKDDDVYDPFLGSGTTMIAAEQLGRRCYGLEISPQYCDVIVQRWEKLTGKTAIRP